MIAGIWLAFFSGWQRCWQVANWLVPFLAASRFGWRSVAYLWGAASGVFAVVWHLLAADAPPSEDSGQAAAGKAEKGRVRWDIFRLPAALCVPWCHGGDNNAMYSLAMLAPTVFTTRLGLAPEHLGPYLAIPPAINVFVSRRFRCRLGCVLLKTAAISLSTGGLRDSGARELSERTRDAFGQVRRTIIAGRFFEQCQ